ncbi:MAG: (Fe-S)-binding protein, partial [Deltaproteobacteria bacterium]|nr:(Fe-S)-binding protein [Deltaproteobacteria bacterium]
MGADAAVTREVFLGLSTGSKIAFYCLTFVTVSLFIWGVMQRIKKYRRSRRFKGFSDIARRITESLKISLSNITIIKDDLYSGLSHLLILWGFLILLVGTAIVAVNIDVLALINKKWTFWHGSFYLWFSLLLDLFGLAFLIGVVMMMLRRAFLKPQCLDYTRVDREPDTYNRANYVVGDWIFLGSLFVIGVSGFIVEGLRIAITQPSYSSWSFVGEFVGGLFSHIAGIEQGGMTAYKVMWWFHSLVSLAFVAYIPYSKAIHMLTDFANLFFKKEVTGEIPLLSEDEIDFDKLGYMELKDFTWKELLDLDACTKCGRCHISCPVMVSGSPLSPRDVILDLRDFLAVKAKAVTLWDSQGGSYKDEKIVGGVIKEETLWSCTTCLSCTEHCPVFIQHLPLMVKMRRHLIEGGFIDEGVQDALVNISECGNSFGEDNINRGKWTNELKFSVKDARKEVVDILWFVGDFASFDSRAVEATKAFAHVLAMLGIDFGILYDSERNSGNDVRRIGEEGLFEELVEHNSKILGGCQFNKIVTTDPHSMNALKVDYPALDHPILHYTELLDKILQKGDTPLKKVLSYKATYHDP